MDCLICGAYFNEPRFLKDLFRTKKFYTCLECIKKYPIEINFNYIPVNNKTLEIVSLFASDWRINYDVFFNEYSIIYQNIIKNNENKLVIMFNKFYLTESILLDFEYISTLVDKDIIILTNVLFN